MSNPINFISLKSKGVTYKIPVNVDVKKTVQGCTDHFFLSEINGFFGGFENDKQPVERTFVSGSVLPSKPRFSGRDFEFSVIISKFPEKEKELKELFTDFKAFFINSDIIEVTSDFEPKVLHCQVQRFEVVNDWKKNTPVVVRVFMKAAEV